MPYLNIMDQQKQAIAQTVITTCNLPPAKRSRGRLQKKAGEHTTAEYTSIASREQNPSAPVILATAPTAITTSAVGRGKDSLAIDTIHDAVLR
ncbi:hypothetical protein SeMB42_g03917 [Synchytrium endobioticum]|uniref:Uncharacterized protein n=1 Tax=Synchytrium endobioticum TaxID=286115 RepID=A0A507D2V2_9FUNG|nr:hypothetical protein SeMB42_g03917 [Synchytrium endobioticum]